MRKRATFICKFLALTAMLGLVGCESSPNPTVSNKPNSKNNDMPAPDEKGPESATPAKSTQPSDSSAKTASSAPTKIVFVTNSDSTFWDAAQKGAEDLQKELNIKVDFIRNKEGTAEGQIKRLEQALTTADVKGVVVSVVDSKSSGIVDRMTKLQDKGIPVITFDSDTGANGRSARKFYVGTNNVSAGKVAGEIAKKLAPEGGKVMAFVGNKDADNARERIEGFKAGAGEKFNLLDVMSDGTDRAKARSNVESAFAKHSDLLMPLGIWSYNAPQIAKVVRSRGKGKLKVVTFDAEPETMAAIKEGIIDGTIVQNTYDMGAVSAKLALYLSMKDEAKIKEITKGNDKVDTGVRVIVPEESALKGSPNVQTVSEFEKYMASKGLKST